MNIRTKNKSVSQKKLIYDNEINLYEVFEILFKHKFKIIIFTIFAAFLGATNFYLSPKSYEITTVVSTAKSSVFTDYFRINKNMELAENLISSKDVNNNVFTKKEIFKIESQYVFNYFLDEFYDYEEVKKVLEQEGIINNLVLDELEEFEKLNVINNLSKNFQILKSDSDKEDFIVSISWHDPSQGIKIFKKVIDLVLENTKLAVINDIDQFFSYIDYSKKNNIELLEKKILSILNFQKIIDQQRINHLSEQLKLAQTIGLDKSLTYKTEDLEISDRNLNKLNFKNSPTEYLRGYVVIAKELELLLNRDSEALLLSNPEFAILKNEIDLLKNDNLAEIIKKDLNLIIEDNPENWINLDLGINNINSLHKPISFHLISASLLGLILFSFLTLFYSSLNKNRNIIK